MTDPMFRVLIVDDEPLARQRLVTLLNRVPDIDIVGECQNGLEAVASIKNQKPDLVFLDVQMPELDGFDVITEVGTDKMPPVIFVTAFDDYAVSAFEFGAFDYLLKPVDNVRFHQTLDRAKKRLSDSGSPSVSSQLGALLKYVGQLDGPKNRIGVKVNGKILFLDPGRDLLDPGARRPRANSSGRGRVRRARAAEPSRGEAAAQSLSPRPPLDDREHRAGARGTAVRPG